MDRPSSSKVRGRERILPDGYGITICVWNWTSRPGRNTRSQCAKIEQKVES